MASSFTHDKCNDAQPPIVIELDLHGLFLTVISIPSTRQNIQVTQKIADFPLGAMQVVHNLLSTYCVRGMLPVQQ